MKQAVIYARVSGDSQREEKTIESQIAELRELCEKDKVKIVKEYIDDGWTGETLARPALDKLRDDAGKGIFETLYMWKTDRLGRDHIDQGIVKRELKKQGIKIIISGILLTEQNKLQNDIEALLAEYEKRQFMERTRRGKLHKAKNGKLMRCRPPFGYRFVEKAKEWILEIVPEETKFVMLVFKLYFQYQSIGKVVKELLDRGFQTKNNCVWNRSQITNMLNNEAYIGLWHYNKNKNVEPKIRKQKFYKKVRSSHIVRDKKDWIILEIPAIIDKEVFENAQELLKRNHKIFTNTKEIYLLTGLLRCKECGSRMIGMAHNKKFKKKNGEVSIYRNHYYRCSIAHKSFPYPQSSVGRYVHMEELDNLVWRKIKEAFQNPKVLLQYISHLNKDRNTETLKEEKQDLLKKKVQIKKSKDKLFELYDLEQIEKEDLAERIGNFSQAEKEIDKLLKEIEVRLSQADSKSIVIESIKQLSKLTKSQLNLLSPEEKKSFLKVVIKEITYDPAIRELDVVGHIPMVKAKRQPELEKILSPSLLSLSS